MPFKKLEFIFPWRSYQEKFINNINKHIDDNHLHVVAPPGSGKTILGIEIIRQVGKRTLVLAPTLTVRNQWENRLQTFFIKDGLFVDFSFDINNPKGVTFCTYQSLHSFFKKFENKADYYAFFERENIEAIVLDEAHHLKNEWWKCLIELKQINSLTIVALTATPPYDSDALEVSKYFNLCGEIDEEIAVPELVKEGDLCPHQDFVYFSKPEDKEINFIFEYRMRISDFLDELKQNRVFTAFLNNHRFLKSTETCLNEIYSNPEYFSAILIFLNAVNQEISKEKLYILGFEKKEKVEFPVFTNGWAEVLFQNLIVSDRLNLIKNELFLNDLETKLRRLNIFENKKVDLVGDNQLYRSLSNSPSKLKSIVAIISNEYKNLKSDLRAVVLTDYIKKEFKATADKDVNLIDRLGVIPIFQHLRTNAIPKKEIAVLTGTLVIIHKSTIEAFEQIEPFEKHSFIPFETDLEYVEIVLKVGVNHLVNTITKLFELGEIKILIGTKSLLGEGWDAPSINTLVLASFVGSYVSSNQMRGRAIRTQKGNLHKTGNIWHLVCLDPTDSKGGKDIETLTRRFDAFVGVSNSEDDYIESGISRLNLPTNYADVTIESLNEQTLSQSKKRENLKNKWKHAIGKGTGISREIKQNYLGKEPYDIEKNQVFNDVVRYSFLELSVALSFFLPQFLVKNLNVLLTNGVMAFIYSLLTALGLTFGWKTYKSIKNYIQFGLLHKDLNKISKALLDTMYDLNLVSTNKDKIFLSTDILPKGEVVCAIKGASEMESALFINSIQEIIEPIKNPRYLIVKTNWFRKNFDIQNYYSVPELFGDKKKRCEVFLKNWKNHVGDSEVFYTRHLEGRKILLKARMFHLSNSFNETTKKAVIWN
ncbi:DEAD/DEAH box helicase family protein [Mariniflexile sp. HNIBRBA6329]|uniref:DEAD/DEAH box helicase family protein n=1 Tax=Mariniflexile sp. HNIBRBA6329 TaxID=3373088 RepID=UPI00374579FF